jgi:hypothetical protein
MELALTDSKFSIQEIDIAKNHEVPNCKKKKAAGTPAA